MTTFNEDEYIFKGLKNGADGYILKDISSQGLVKNIKSIYKGDTLLHGDVARTISNVVKAGKNKKDEGALDELTPRELEIAILIGQGKNNKEISQLLYITEGTVKNHITKILDKLEVRDRTQIAILLS